MKKYRLMLTALLGAAFLFAPHETAEATGPADTISVTSVETVEGAESDWLSGYYYELLDDGVNEPVVALKKCYLSGDISVPGTAAAGGRTYRTLVTKECFSNCVGITSLSFLESDGIKPLADEDMTNAFSRDPYLESIDISGLDLSKTANIYGMFSKNERLSSLLLSNDTLGTFYDEPKVRAESLFSESPLITELDLSGFDTTNVVNMSHIFSSMKGLQSLMFGGAFDTSNVTDLSYAFYDCPSFTGTLDLSAWNVAGKSSTANNTTMRSMFELFPARNIILTRFSTSSVTDMTYAFADTSFSEIDLSSFDTSNVGNMYGMFDGTKVEDDFLDSVTLGSRWNTSGVKSFSRMFNHRYITNSCANVFAAKTDVKSATSLYQMFYDTKVNCDSDHKTLSGAVLNLSGWDVSSVEDCRRFLKSGTVSCNLTGWNISALQFGDDAFGGQAQRATPASTASAIESKLVPASDLDDSSKYSSYYYQRGYAGHTKDGRDFMKAADSNYDTVHSIFGTTSLPIHYNVQVTMSYYNSDNEFYTATNPYGIFYAQVNKTDSYSASINRIQTPYTPEQEKWFCPYKAGLKTNGKEDRYYYEIYGYSDGRFAFKYAPTQSEWDATVKRCMYSGTMSGFRDICNEGKYLTNRVYGFKEVDISEYVGSVEIQDPTVENGGIDLTGTSGNDYTAEYEESGMPFEMPFSNVNYVIGRGNTNAIRPVEKNGFAFIGWFDTKGNDLTENSNGVYTPAGAAKESIIPHYKVDEKEVTLSVTFDAGEDAPEGLSLSFDPESLDCFSLTREGNKWTGTFSTMLWLKGRSFKLPSLSIEGMDEEKPEHEFLGWEGEEGSFTVSSADTEKSFKAVFKHNEKPAADPGTDDPAQGDPTQDDPTQGDPTQGDPTQDDPTQDDPTQDDPAKDDPAKDDPTKDDPANDDPAKEDPAKDDPAKDDPSKDDPAKDDPAKEDPAQDDPAKDDPAKEDPAKDEPSKDDPAKDDPAKDDPTKDDPAKDDPAKDDPVKDDPSKDDPEKDEPSSELSEKIKSLNEELSALREEKANADGKNAELVESLNKKIAELENTINTLQARMSKNDEVPASTERGGNEGSGRSGGSSYSTSGNTANTANAANTSARVSEGEKAGVRVFETPSVSAQNRYSVEISKAVAQPEPHYAYKASNGKVKLNYDTSVSAVSKDTVEEYGFFTGEAKQDKDKVSSERNISSKTAEKQSLSSDEMKKAAGNAAAHDGGLLEAQNIGRSIFGVMILVIVTGCAIFFTFRKKAIKKNRRSRK